MLLSLNRISSKSFPRVYDIYIYIYIYVYIYISVMTRISILWIMHPYKNWWCKRDWKKHASNVKGMLVIYILNISYSLLNIFDYHCQPLQLCCDSVYQKGKSSTSRCEYHSKLLSIQPTTRGRHLMHKLVFMRLPTWRPAEAKHILQPPKYIDIIVNRFSYVDNQFIKNEL